MQLAVKIQLQDITDENVTVLGYREPAVKGSKTFLICPTESELVGVRTSRCAANGQWNPNSREVNCKFKGESLCHNTLLKEECSNYVIFV